MVFRPLCATLLLLSSIQAAHAGIVINGTRVIYPAERREVTLQLSNTGEYPALAQSWIDSGNMDSQAASEDAPFVILPPVAQVDAGRSQTLRIMYSGAPLASDRETLYWLNVLDIPPELDNTESKNYLQFAVRSRLKLFFRPEGLKGNPAKAARKLTWQLDEAKGVLRVDNPTPYHVTLDRIQLDWHPLDSGMVKPFSRLELPLPAKISVKLPATLQFAHISDYGAAYAHQIQLKR